MSTLIVTVLVIALLTILGYFAAKEEYRLKSASIVFLVVLLLSSSTLSTEWSRMTSELVDNDEDPHYGLPDLWDGKQVVCFHFPDGAAPSEFADGYTNGLELFNAAVAATDMTFAYTYTEFSFGLQIDSISGVSPCDTHTCTEDFSSGAWWQLLDNGAISLVGISDLELDSDSVITWRIATY